MSFQAAVAASTASLPQLMSYHSLDTSGLKLSGTGESLKHVPGPSFESEKRDENLSLGLLWDAKGPVAASSMPTRLLIVTARLATGGSRMHLNGTCLGPLLCFPRAR